MFSLEPHREACKDAGFTVVFGGDVTQPGFGPFDESGHDRRNLQAQTNASSSQRFPWLGAGEWCALPYVTGFLETVQHGGLHADGGHCRQAVTQFQLAGNTMVADQFGRIETPAERLARTSEIYRRMQAEVQPPSLSGPPGAAAAAQAPSDPPPVTF